MSHRALDLLYRVFSQMTLLCCYILISFLKKKKETGKKIAALPYSPKNWPGGHERIANWKPFFNNENILFDVFWASSEKEFTSYLNAKHEYIRYIYFFKVFWRRIKLLHKLKQYDVIWIQRAFIPSYPYKSAYFEKLISKIHPNLIIDYYDADYEANYNLTIESVKAANKISVSTEFLQHYFSQFNPNVFQVNMTLDHNLYSENRKKNSDKIKIGWMGNEGNLPHLHQLKDVFKKIESSYPSIEFHFVCRKKMDFNVKNLSFSTWEDEDFDYYDWLSSISIGLAPYLDDSDVQKAKSPMKTLEFLSSKIPLIASSYGSFPGMLDNQHFMLADTKTDWFNHIEVLINNESKRNNLAEEGHNFMLKHHTYEVNYDNLKTIFFNLS